MWAQGSDCSNQCPDLENGAATAQGCCDDNHMKCNTYTSLEKVWHNSYNNKNYVPSHLLSNLHILTHLILTTTLWGAIAIISYFTARENEAWNSHKTCQMPHRSQDLNVGCLALRSMLLTTLLSPKLASSQRIQFLSNIPFLFSVQKLFHAQEKKSQSSFVSFLRDWFLVSRNKRICSLICHAACV